MIAATSLVEVRDLNSGAQHLCLRLSNGVRIYDLPISLGHAAGVMKLMDDEVPAHLDPVPDRKPAPQRRAAVGGPGLAIIPDDDDEPIRLPASPGAFVEEDSDEL